MNSVLFVLNLWSNCFWGYWDGTGSPHLLKNLVNVLKNIPDSLKFEYLLSFFDFYLVFPSFYSQYIEVWKMLVNIEHSLYSEGKNRDIIDFNQKSYYSFRLV